MEHISGKEIGIMETVQMMDATREENLRTVADRDPEKSFDVQEM